MVCRILDTLSSVFEYAISVCSGLCVRLRGSPELEEYLLSTEELVCALKDNIILRRWNDCENTLESGTALQPSTAHQVNLLCTPGWVFLLLKGVHSPCECLMGFSENQLKLMKEVIVVDIRCR